METLSLWGGRLSNRAPAAVGGGGWGRCGALRRKHLYIAPSGAEGDGFPRQSADWLGMTTLWQSEMRRGTDCHTSDVGHWFAMTGISGQFAMTGEQKPSRVVIPRSEATWESVSLVPLSCYGGRGGSCYRGTGQRQRSGSGKLWWHSPFDGQRHTGKPITREARSKFAAGCSALRKS